MDIMDALKEQNVGVNVFDWKSGSIFDWMVLMNKIDY